MVYRALVLALLLANYILINCVHATDFVGSQQCVSCHEKEFNAWQGSHHDMAMKHADENSVLGNFNNAEIMFNGQKNRFFKKQQQFWVTIAGKSGELEDYQIKYTFGFEPLQQYMVEFDDGRVQLIPFAWDSRKKVEGGQRWYHLYPQFTDNREEFFWTNTGQNWNYMCADCHSTNVNKNYNVDNNTYNTSFSEINVACEACHGPASEHLLWANSPKKDRKNLGFERNLSKSVSNWLNIEGKNTLQPEHINHSQQTLVCAQCHSRHVQISESDHVEKNNFGERYMLNLITSDLYYPDGQIYDEDYVYGSFLQSKMAKKGVVCSDCHDPHTAKLKMPVESLCLQCHKSDIYAVKSHHQHQANSAGAQCVNCHMAETTYMQVDPRRDHGWHIPRPDLAKQLGTPDTCLSCHKDKNSQWSDEQVQQWFPNSAIRQEDHFAPVFSAAAMGYPEAANALSHVSQNKANADIIRASALEKMARYSNTNTLIAIARGAKDENGYIRLGAARGAAGIALKERWRILAPLLKDNSKAVRSEAAFSLLSFWKELNQQQRAVLQPALDEYMDIQTFNQDRGFAHTNKGVAYTYLQQFDKAESAFQTSIQLEPNFANAYLNLAELYRRQGKEEQVQEVLSSGIAGVVNNAGIAYQLGLAYIRNKQNQKAVTYFQLATEQAPDNAQYHYVYALSIEAEKPTVAQQSMKRAFQVGGNPQHLYALCEMQIKHRAFGAKQCLKELSKYAPEDVIERLRAQLK